MSQRCLGSGEAGKPTYLPLSNSDVLRCHSQAPRDQRSTAAAESPPHGPPGWPHKQRELLDGGGEVSASPSVPDASPQEVGRIPPGDEQIVAVASGIWGAKRFSRHLPFLPLPLLLVSETVFPCFSFGNSLLPTANSPVPSIKVLCSALAKDGLTTSQTLCPGKSISEQ